MGLNWRCFLVQIHFFLLWLDAACFSKHRSLLSPSTSVLRNYSYRNWTINVSAENAYLKAFYFHHKFVVGWNPQQRLEVPWAEGKHVPVPGPYCHRPSSALPPPPRPPLLSKRPIPNVRMGTAYQSKTFWQLQHSSCSLYHIRHLLSLMFANNIEDFGPSHK